MSKQPFKQMSDPMSTRKFIDDGGSAFPYGFINERGGQTIVMGMTRRDWLAGMAMQGLLAHKALDVLSTHDKLWAAAMYGIADIMIEASKNGGSHE